MIDFDKSFLLEVISEAPYGVIVFDSNGMIILENALALSFLGTKKETIVNAQIIEQFDVFELNELIEQILEGERERFDIMEMVFQDKVLTIRCRKRDNWSILTVQDITRWKNIEMSSVQSIIETQENERRRIALEIHDGIGPQLSSSIYHLETIIDRLKEDDPQTANELQSLVEVSNDVSEELRSVSHSLMPRVLLDFGIVAALQGLINRINASNKCRVEFINSFSGEELDQAIELNLYRITQELLNNGVKHANATTIFVQLVKNGDRLTLMVEDNGRGFEMSELTNSDGIGLSNIEMRTKVLGGELNIDSSPNRGTVITIEVLLNEN
ncbi:MAG: signal transduction histidine kinase [Patiriisocius sp.]|jgi:signal transduction histidine kinase